MDRGDESYQVLRGDIKFAEAGALGGRDQLELFVDEKVKSQSVRKWYRSQLNLHLSSSAMRKTRKRVKLTPERAWASYPPWLKKLVQTLLTCCKAAIVVIRREGDLNECVRGGMEWNGMRRAWGKESES